MSISLGRLLSPTGAGRVISLLTSAFGAGQIIGPLAAGLLAERTHGFAVPLSCAAAVVGAGVVCLVMGRVLADRPTAAP